MLLFAAISDELQANMLEMPFLGDDVSFFVLLPEGITLEEMVARLTVDNLRDAMARTFPLNLEVGLPKFRLEQTLNLRRVRHDVMCPLKHSIPIYTSRLGQSLVLWR